MLHQGGAPTHGPVGPWRVRKRRWASIPRWPFGRGETKRGLRSLSAHGPTGPRSRPPPCPRSVSLSQKRKKLVCSSTNVMARSVMAYHRLSTRFLDGGTTSLPGCDSGERRHSGVATADSEKNVAIPLSGTVPLPERAFENGAFPLSGTTPYLSALLGNDRSR